MKGILLIKIEANCKWCNILFRKNTNTQEYCCGKCKNAALSQRRLLCRPTKETERWLDEQGAAQFKEFERVTKNAV